MVCFWESYQVLWMLYILLRGLGTMWRLLSSANRVNITHLANAKDYNVKYTMSTFT